MPEHRSSWEKLEPQQILQRLFDKHPPPFWVTLSGGNPALFDLAELLRLGHQWGYRFALETQGSIAQPWFRDLDHLTVSPKPPSSGNITPPREAVAALCAANRITRKPDPIGGVEMEFVSGPSRTVKIVVFDDDDYRYAQAIRDLIPPDAFDPRLEFVLSVGNRNVSQAEGPNVAELLRDCDWLIGKALADGWHDVRITPQLHVLLYGNRRGV